MKRYRRYNPFPTFQTKVEDALKLIEIITKNAESVKAKKPRRYNPYEPKWDASIIDTNLDPEGKYTPAYIVAKNLEPPVRKEVLKILFSENRPFYEKLIARTERLSGSPWNYAYDKPEHNLDPTDPKYSYDPTLNWSKEVDDPDVGKIKTDFLADSYTFLKQHDPSFPKTIDYDDTRNTLSFGHWSKKPMRRRHRYY